MKSITKILFVAGLAYAMAAISCFGQVITFDENGHGNLNGNPLPFFVGPGPIRRSSRERTDLYLAIRGHTRRCRFA